MEGIMNLKNFASSIIIKLIVSLILASAIVMSIAHFLHSFHEYLAQFINGSTIETISYAVILIGSGIGIYLLLVDKPEKKIEPSPATSTLPLPHDFSLQALGLQFLEGFMSGVTKRKDVPPKF
jgi:hypothetical protein